MILQVARLVHGVEFDEDLQRFRASLERRDQFARDGPGSDPDRVDAVIVERFTAVEDLLGHSAVDAANRDLRAFWDRRWRLIGG